MPPAQLDDALARLSESGLAFRRGTPPDATYTFKHALVQDAAYDSLLKSRRQELHAKIVRVIEQRFPTVETTEPEVLAHHCEEAGLTQKAMSYWRSAGQQGIARFAMAEAISQLRRGLALISALPDNAVRQAHELDLTSMLGHTLMATQGFSAQESGDLFDRSRQLCEQLGRPQQLASVLHGQSVYRFVRAELDRANEHAREMIILGEQSNDIKMKHDGLYMSGVLCSVMGKFMDARVFCEGALHLWNPDFRTITASPEDPYVGIRLYYYRALVCLGYLDQGRLFRAEAVTEARRLAPFSLAYALYQHWLGDWAMEGAARVDAMLQTADETLAIANEHGFALWLAIGKVQRGWCLTMSGGADEGIELILAGLVGCKDTGCGIVVPFWLALLAEAYGHAGRFGEALERLADAQRMIETTQEAWPAAEVHRLRGQVLLKMNNREAAEDSFRHALDVARRQSAKFWELRAATNLARLWCAQGRSSEARQLLRPVHDWFTEGFDSKDLLEAKALLTDLG
jgi:tetratricopeptide (TPR) repeat protein